MKISLDALKEGTRYMFDITGETNAYSGVLDKIAGNTLVFLAVHQGAENPDNMFEKTVEYDNLGAIIVDVFGKVRSSVKGGRRRSYGSKRKSKKRYYKNSRSYSTSKRRHTTKKHFGARKLRRR